MEILIAVLRGALIKDLEPMLIVPNCSEGTLKTASSTDLFPNYCVLKFNRHFLQGMVG